MKRAIKRQPIRDTVEAERTTTITLPARLTRAPRPAPTMTWASCTMQVRAAQSMPVPRLSRAGSSLPNFLCSYDKRGVLHKKKAIILDKIFHMDLKYQQTSIQHCKTKITREVSIIWRSEVSYNELWMPESLTESIACSLIMLRWHVHKLPSKFQALWSNT